MIQQQAEHKLMRRKISVHSTWRETDRSKNGFGEMRGKHIGALLASQRKKRFQ